MVGLYQNAQEDMITGMIETDYSQLLYKRGYVLSEAKIVPVTGWQSRRVGSYHLCFDPDNHLAYAYANGEWIAILGNIIDTQYWLMDSQTIANNCLASLAYSEDRLLDYIDYLNGRFVLVYHHGGKTRFMTDAFGMRSAFYSLDEPVIVASHCRIISDHLHSKQSETMAAIDKANPWRMLWARGNPGVITPYDGVYLLTPNTCIDLEERRICRFYPRNPLAQRSLKEVIDEIADTLQRQFILLNRTRKLAVSLSAGLDSRTTLAAGRDIASDLLFFTYSHGTALTPQELLSRAVERNELEQFMDYLHEYLAARERKTAIDLAVPCDIVTKLGLQHIIIEDVDVDQTEYRRFDSVLNQNSYHNHCRRLAFDYLRRMPPNMLHIRSNVYECTRALHRRGNTETPMSAADMAEFWGNRNDSMAIESFRRFIEITNFKSILNYDSDDMFLWEHHDGAWATYIYLESDVAFDTFQLCGSRALMDKVYSTPMECRIRSELGYQVIMRLWPLLLMWPMNQMPYAMQVKALQDQVKELQDQVKSLRDRVASKTKDIKSLRQSTTYQVGLTLGNAVLKPGRNTVLLPWRLVGLYKNRRRRMGGTRAK